MVLTGKREEADGRLAYGVIRSSINPTAGNYKDAPLFEVWRGKGS
jgi:hypothetical protein